MMIAFATLLAFLAAFGFSRASFNNALRRGLVDPTRFLNFSPGQLHRAQAIEMAIALTLHRFGFAPFEVRGFVDRYLADVLNRKVDVLFLGAQAGEAAPGDESLAKSPMGMRLAGQVGLRVLNCGEINRRVDRMLAEASASTPVKSAAELKHFAENELPRFRENVKWAGEQQQRKKRS